MPIKTIFEINEKELTDTIKRLKPRERKSIILLRLIFFFFLRTKKSFSKSLYCLIKYEKNLPEVPRTCHKKSPTLNYSSTLTEQYTTRPQRTTINIIIILLLRRHNIIIYGSSFQGLFDLYFFSTPKGMIQRTYACRPMRGAQIYIMNNNIPKKNNNTWDYNLIDTLTRVSCK